MLHATLSRPPTHSGEGHRRRPTTCPGQVRAARHWPGSRDAPGMRGTQQCLRDGDAEVRGPWKLGLGLTPPQHDPRLWGASQLFAPSRLGQETTLPNAPEPRQLQRPRPSLGRGCAHRLLALHDPDGCGDRTRGRTRVKEQDRNEARGGGGDARQAAPLHKPAGPSGTSLALPPRSFSRLPRALCALSAGLGDSGCEFNIRISQSPFVGGAFAPP